MPIEIILTGIVMAVWMPVAGTTLHFIYKWMDKKENAQREMEQWA